MWSAWEADEAQIILHLCPHMEQTFQPLEQRQQTFPPSTSERRPGESQWEEQEDRLSPDHERSLKTGKGTVTKKAQPCDPGTQHLLCLRLNKEDRADLQVTSNHHRGNKIYPEHKRKWHSMRQKCTGSTKSRREADVEEILQLAVSIPNSKLNQHLKMCHCSQYVFFRLGLQMFLTAANSLFTSSKEQDSRNWGKEGQLQLKEQLAYEEDEAYIQQMRVQGVPFHT